MSIPILAGRSRKIFSTTIPIYQTPPSTGTTYYVDAVNGSDSNNGLAPGSGHAFATLQHAASFITAGVTILLYNGTYTASSGNPFLNLSGINGSATNWTVIKAAPGQSPILQGNGNDGIDWVKSSYVCIAGLTLVGNAASLTQSGAFSDHTNIIYNTSGISFGGSSRVGLDSHHLQVLNCNVSNFTEAGIVFLFCDYVTVQGCVVFDNCFYSYFQGSGISLYELHNFDTAAGFHCIVNGNITYGNQIFVGQSGTSASGVTDGEGIIIDDSNNDQSDNVPYTSAVLVSNNISYNNGSFGVLAYDSNNCTFVHNTCYHNTVTPLSNMAFSPVYEIGNTSDIGSLNNIMFNNIAYPSSNTVPYITSNGGSTYGFNITFGGTGTAPGSNNITSDPSFASTTLFTLNASSPAIDAATSAHTVAFDIYGNARPGGSRNTIGAVQWPS